MSNAGIVKNYNPMKGFGFITAEDGTEVFVHFSACNGAAPAEGDEVIFDVEPSPKNGQPCAVNVQGCTGDASAGGKGKGKAGGCGGCQKGWGKSEGFVAKGKGKSKGENGGKDGKGKGGKGHTLPRTRITAEKFSGVVSAWKGKYGWITPDEEIPHEKAALRNGSLFFGIGDLEGGLMEMPEGTPVLFHICEDASGLGAEEVEATGRAAKGAAKGKGAGVKGVAGKGATKGGTWTAPAKGTSWAAPVKGAATKGVAASGKGVVAKGAAAPAKGVKGWPAAGKGVADGGKAKGQGDGKGKGDGKKGKAPGHLLPRTRITAEKFTGTVHGWKGKYGWIQPAEEIGHEKAAKNSGRLFAGKDDLVDIEELTEGATVEFHIFEDASGLGAEEIVQY